MALAGQAKSELLFGAADDVILDFFRQYHELRAIARNANHQVLVLLRIFLRLQQRVAIDNVKLYVHPFLIEVVTHQTAKVSQTLFPRQRGGQEFLVVERSVRGDKVIQFGYRVGCGGPRVSLPWRGDTPSASGSFARRPSGRALTSLPNSTFADTG